MNFIEAWEKAKHGDILVHGEEKNGYNEITKGKESLRWDKTGEPVKSITTMLSDDWWIKYKTITNTMRMFLPKNAKNISVDYDKLIVAYDIEVENE